MKKRMLVCLVTLLALATGGALAVEPPATVSAGEPACATASAETPLLAKILGTVTTESGATMTMVKGDLETLLSLPNARRIDKAGCFCAPQCYPVYVCHCWGGTGACCSGCCAGGC